ncbi:MAG: hypothetical protein U0470_02020 [Anaerolineae bacterium]
MPRCTIVPHRSSPLRPADVSAAALVASLLTALAACRPAPTTSPPPITWPSPWPSATLDPSRGHIVPPPLTPTPTPTPTARPTIDPSVSLPVSMSLDEARSEVLTWLDPTREPRIEWSGYVARDDLDVFGDVGACLTDDLWRVGPADGDEPLPDVGIVVIASTWGLSMGLEGSHGGGSRVDVADGCNSASDERERIVGLFDARTGRRLVVTMDSWIGDGVVAKWHASKPRIRSVPVRTAAPMDAATAPPTPVAPVWPTPSGPPVDRDTIPPAFRETLRAYPLLPGSRWTWRTVARYEGVAWRSSLLTETVEAAWLVAPDRLAVRATRRRTVLHEGLIIEASEAPAEEELWRLILPEGFVALDERPADVGASYSDIWYEPDGLRPGLIMEGWPFPHDRITMGSAVWGDGAISVLTPAGRFDGCRALHVVGGAAWGSTRAFCPGVGYVTTDSGACSMCYAALGTMDLVSYDVAPPR